MIDTDPDVDDAKAIMMAFAHPGAQVEAITTEVGCVSLERTPPRVKCMIGADLRRRSTRNREAATQERK